MRASGVLLHVTSLPGSPGLGDLGSEAESFVESLAAAGQAYWQVLPLGPTGWGDSPYQCLSTFAGNPLLVSPERLADDGLLTGDLPPAPAAPAGTVDFGAVIPWKRELLARAWETFRAGGSPASLSSELAAFRERERDWLHDYVLFAAIHDEEGTAWVEWPPELRRRKPAALAAARERLADEIGRHELLQFLFHRQWDALRAFARERGIRILGDVPFFVAHDSADVWTRPELFEVGGDGALLRLSGAPPDAFTDDGQLWGAPLYRWDVHERRGFDWWIARMRKAAALFDLVRLDHFRGFCANWVVPCGEATAANGAWEPVPGRELLTALRDALGALPFVAEDLGIISPDVWELRDEFGLPGMAVLMFGFGGDPIENPFAPYNVARNMFAYPGTHDTETVRGWFDEGIFSSMKRPREDAERERDRVLLVTGSDGSDIAWAMCRTTMATAARAAILPVQDLLGLGNEARMNLPERIGGNWVWRLEKGQWDDDVVARLAELTRATGRWPEEGTT